MPFTDRLDGVSLPKDELTMRVRQCVELEELKNKEGKTKDLRDTLSKRVDQSRTGKHQFGREFKGIGGRVIRGKTMNFWPKEG
ncbi:hypothetical protein LIER_00559 [Lithospermum erythrorhizon]|uniref:Uncharacterized protein n=1 Tax=Lithospermum erythrorhizon TaxID=34254 RepID=A0AAV3NMC2_LITER